MMQICFMDEYLPSSVVYDIYSYMSWYDLSQIQNVPDTIWEYIFKYFCQDCRWAYQVERYWGNISPEYNKLSYRDLFLSVKNHNVSIIYYMSDSNDINS